MKHIMIQNFGIGCLKKNNVSLKEHSIMKKILCLTILILLSCIQTYANENYKHLIKEYRFKCDSITDIEGTINYCERLINPIKFGKPSLALVLHSGKEKGAEGKNLSAPAVKSLIEYAIKTRKKVLIIVPHYPFEPGEYSYMSNALVMRIVKDKVNKYSIPQKKRYIIGASFGGSAAYSIIHHNKNFFKNALIVSFANDYSNEVFKNTNVYYIAGDKDKKISLAVKKSIESLKSNKKISVKYNIFKNKNHIEAMNSAYTDDVWDWLFDTPSTYKKQTVTNKIFTAILACLGIILLLLLLYKIAAHIGRKKS